MSLVGNERVKLTAGYLNTGAGACLTAGVVAPTAAAIFGVGGPVGFAAPLTLIFGMTTFPAMSVALHVAARHVLRGLKG